VRGSLGPGHDGTTNNHRYVETDLAMKERALARREPTDRPTSPCIARVLGLTPSSTADATTM
jgi:hypothetical protein